MSARRQPRPLLTFTFPKAYWNWLHDGAPPSQDSAVATARSHFQPLPSFIDGPTVLPSIRTRHRFAFFRERTTLTKCRSPGWTTGPRCRIQLPFRRTS